MVCQKHILIASKIAFTFFCKFLYFSFFFLQTISMKRCTHAPGIAWVFAEMGGGGLNGGALVSRFGGILKN